MRGRLQCGFAEYAVHGVVRAFARGAAGAVGDRHKAWREWLKPFDGAPEVLFHLRCFGREELEGDLKRLAEWERHGRYRRKMPGAMRRHGLAL